MTAIVNPFLLQAGQWNRIKVSMFLICDFYTVNDTACIFNIVCVIILYALKLIHSAHCSLYGRAFIIEASYVQQDIMFRMLIPELFKLQSCCNSYYTELNKHVHFFVVVVSKPSRSRLAIVIAALATVGLHYCCNQDVHFSVVTS